MKDDDVAFGLSRFGGGVGEGRLGLGGFASGQREGAGEDGQHARGDSKGVGQWCALAKRPASME